MVACFLPCLVGLLGLVERLFGLFGWLCVFVGFACVCVWLVGRFVCLFVCLFVRLLVCLLVRLFV